jgi:uncharacterized protein (TIGR03000 family)
MYSVVLMMALSGGPEAVDFGGRRCNGCNNNGCHGAVAACHGGNGCHRSRGCHGGGLFSRHGCNHGCNNGCHAVSHGCNGSACHGGNGCHRSRGCHGGGLFSRHRNRCHGCNGGCNGGCHASHGCHNGCTGGGVIIEEKKTMPKDKKVQEEEVSATSPATIVVSLPANAQLTFDGNATTSTSSRRVFVTPALETGADYTYTLRAQVGDAVQSRIVTVRGGETTNVSFTFEPQGVASR